MGDEAGDQGPIGGAVLEQGVGVVHPGLDPGAPGFEQFQVGQFAFVVAAAGYLECPFRPGQNPVLEQDRLLRGGFQVEEGFFRLQQDPVAQFVALGPCPDSFGPGLGPFAALVQECPQGHLRADAKKPGVLPVASMPLLESQTRGQVRPECRGGRRLPALLGFQLQLGPRARSGRCLKAAAFSWSRSASTGS